MANEANGNIRLTFEISNGDQLLRREEISAESVTIGRGPAAMLRIEDDALAELHEASGLSSDLRVQPVLLLPRLKVICSHERPLPPHRGRGHGWAAWQSSGEERKRMVRMRKRG